MFCPDCGTWNRGSAVICARCSHELPEVSDAPTEKPDEEMDLLRRAAGGRYRIFRRLATGGMASVYAAKHVQLGRQLVVKVLLGHLARDRLFHVNWLARSCGRLDHGHTKLFGGG